MVTASPIKIFLSYKYTGLSLDELHKMIDPIVDFFKNAGYDIYCNLYDDDFYYSNKMNTKQIMNHALEKLDECNFQIILWDRSYSEGTIVEFGRAYGRMPQMLLIKEKSLSSTVICMADEVIEYKSLDNLMELLPTIDLEKYFKDVSN